MRPGTALQLQFPSPRALQKQVSGRCAGSVAALYMLLVLSLAVAPVLVVLACVVGPEAGLRTALYLGAQEGQAWGRECGRRVVRGARAHLAAGHARGSASCPYQLCGATSREGFNTRNVQCHMAFDVYKYTCDEGNGL